MTVHVDLTICSRKLGASSASHHGRLPSSWTHAGTVPRARASAGLPVSVAQPVGEWRCCCRMSDISVAVRLRPWFSKKDGPEKNGLALGIAMDGSEGLVTAREKVRVVCLVSGRLHSVPLAWGVRGCVVVLLSGVQGGVCGALCRGGCDVRGMCGVCACALTNAPILLHPVLSASQPHDDHTGQHRTFQFNHCFDSMKDCDASIDQEDGEKSPCSNTDMYDNMVAPIIPQVLLVQLVYCSAGEVCSLPS